MAADGRPISGKNAYVYISGAALLGANAWSLGVTKDSIEAVQFGDDWKRKVWGQLDGSGTITAWQHQDKKVIYDAVIADGPVSVYVYPDRGDTTNYWMGLVLWTNYIGDGSTSTPVNGSGDFVTQEGTAGLTQAGFA